MNEIINDILNLVGILLFLCAIIRYASFYFLYFRSRTLKHSSTYRISIGAQRFSPKVFYKIDFPVPVRLEWLKKASDGALYISFACIVSIILLITGQMIMK